MELNMKTIVESLEKTGTLGIKCAISTFWKYYSLGLLPQGKKIRGRGNALYVPDDTHLRIRLIQFLNESIGIPLDELSRFFGAHAGNYADLLPPRPLPARVTKLVKKEYQALKIQALGQLFDRLPQLVSSQQQTREAEMGHRPEQVLTSAGMRKPRDFSLEPSNDRENEASLRKVRTDLLD
jgi:hypothetical protein